MNGKAPPLSDVLSLASVEVDHSGMEIGQRISRSAIGVGGSARATDRITTTRA